MGKIAGYICFVVLTIIMCVYNFVFPTQAAQVVDTSTVETIEYEEEYSTTSGDAVAVDTETTTSGDFEELKTLICLLVGLVLGVVLGVLVCGL